MFQIHLLGIASFLNPSPRPEKPCHAMPSTKSWGVFYWIWCGCVDTTRLILGLAGKLDGFFAGLSGWLTVGLMDSIRVWLRGSVQNGKKTNEHGASLTPITATSIY